jgi:hypothetical protein
MDLCICKTAPVINSIGAGSFNEFWSDHEKFQSIVSNLYRKYFKLEVLEFRVEKDRGTGLISQKIAGLSLELVAVRIDSFARFCVCFHLPEPVVQCLNLQSIA